MEFKGTNEIWFLSTREIVSMPSQIKICKVAGKDFEEAKYNAKLISRAPEMLKALQLCVKTLQGYKEYAPIEFIAELKQIIQEATEL